jgi:sugar/nucleoside kinase (ribokinase family)
MGTALFSESIVDLTLSSIDRVRGRGGTVSFDPNLRREMLDVPGLRDALDFVLSRADLFMPSGSELFLFTRAQQEREAVKEMLDRGVKTVVLKRGAGGASCFDSGGELSVPAFPTEEIDPTGAGDCFGATFVCCWLQGMSAMQALRYANAAGALAVRKRGPMEGASTWPEIEAIAGEPGHER